MKTNSFVPVSFVEPNGSLRTGFVNVKAVDLSDPGICWKKVQHGSDTWFHSTLPMQVEDVRLRYTVVAVKSPEVFEAAVREKQENLQSQYGKAWNHMERFDTPGEMVGLDHPPYHGFGSVANANSIIFVKDAIPNRRSTDVYVNNSNGAYIFGSFMSAKDVVDCTESSADKGFIQRPLPEDIQQMSGKMPECEF